MKTKDKLIGIISTIFILLAFLGSMTAITIYSFGHLNYAPAAVELRIP